MSRSTVILVVDDEKQIRRALAGILESRDFVVVGADSAQSAIDATLEMTPDLIVLDLTLPDMDGVDLCARFRTWLDVPILILSVRGDETDKIQALETGADDYLTKPFSAGELVARVNALLRRVRDVASLPPVLDVGPYRIDLAGHRLLRDEQQIVLTPIEFDILALLASNVNRVVTRSQIRQAVWGPDTIVDDRTLRVHVSNLRRKIEPDPSVPRFLLTDPGVGYRFSVG